MNINGCLKYDRATTRLEAMVSDTPKEGGTWLERESVATQIGGMDFGCDFDDCGDCAGQRDIDGDWVGKKRGCCTDCAFYVGYIQTIPLEALEPLIDLFDPKVGYWTPGGCSIPQKWRSYTCLTYDCKSCGVEMAEEVNLMLLNLPILEVV